MDYVMSSLFLIITDAFTSNYIHMLHYYIKIDNRPKWLKQKEIIY